MLGYVIFKNGDRLDWRIAGQTLPAGSTPLVVSDGGVAVQLHGYSDNVFFEARSSDLEEVTKGWTVAAYAATVHRAYVALEEAYA